MATKGILGKDRLLEAKSIIHNDNLLSDILDLRGSTAVFSKTDTQTTIYQGVSVVKFNKTDYIENGVFTLNSDGTIKVNKNISKVLVTINARVNGDLTIYVNGNSGGFNCEKIGASISEIILNGSGIIDVSQGSNISITAYGIGEGAALVGHDRNWFGINLMVIK